MTRIMITFEGTKTKRIIMCPYTDMAQVERWLHEYYPCNSVKIESVFQ